MPTLSVIIVNYNVKYFLELCLLSVQEAARGINTEVFVMDNHSGDGSLEYLRPKFPDVTFIANSGNPGFAVANNRMLTLCKGSYVLLLNPDTVVGEDCFHEALRFMEEHPGAGAVGVKMLDGHGAFLPESKRSFPTPWASFCKLFGLSKLFPGDPRFARYNLLHLSPAEAHEVEVLAGAFMLIRREALEKTGGLDESFFMYGEDIDLSYRLVLSGYSNHYLPLRILHYKGESSKQGDSRYISNFYGAMVVFFRKYYPRSGWCMSFLIRLAIRLKEWQARLRLPRKAADSLPVTGRRLLIACRGEVFPQLEKVCRESIPGIHAVEWKGRGSQPAGAYTDIAFSHPCLGFREMLRRMDGETNKKITYHIYTAASGRLVSPSK